MQVIGFLMYLGLGLVQLFATVDGIAHWTGMSSFFAWIIALVVAYFPLVGTIAGFTGAVSVWGWEWWQAALLFFGGFGVCILLGMSETILERRSQ